eukprot:GDKJ01002575.1.p1 GENE.GDKJ01002575.1~~GDKJ01002575.1.p1  ORF type:complete len:469 (+),score=97.16 GDKJ01002575.1:52-1458(+)
MKIPQEILLSYVADFLDFQTLPVFLSFLNLDSSQIEKIVKRKIIDINSPLGIEKVDFDRDLIHRISLETFSLDIFNVDHASFASERYAASSVDSSFHLSDSNFSGPIPIKAWRTLSDPQSLIVASRRVDYIEIEVDSTFCTNELPAFVAVGVRTDRKLPRNGIVQGWDNRGSAFHSDDCRIYFKYSQNEDIFPRRVQLFCNGSDDGIGADEEEFYALEALHGHEEEGIFDEELLNKKTRRRLGVGVLWTKNDITPFKMNASRSDDPRAFFRHPLSFGVACRQGSLADAERIYNQSESRQRGYAKAKKVWETRLDLVKTSKRGNESLRGSEILARHFYTVDGKFVGFGDVCQGLFNESLNPVLTLSGEIHCKLIDGLKEPFLFDVDEVFPPLFKEKEFNYKINPDVESFILVDKSLKLNQNTNAEVSSDSSETSDFSGTSDSDSVEESDDVTISETSDFDEEEDLFFSS